MARLGPFVRVCCLPTDCCTLPIKPVKLPVRLTGLPTELPAYLALGQLGVKELPQLLF